MQTQLQEATELLQASPRDEKLYRTLHRTYLHPALTQEQAADLLEIYHLVLIDAISKQESHELRIFYGKGKWYQRELDYFYEQSESK